MHRPTLTATLCALAACSAAVLPLQPASAGTKVKPCADVIDGTAVLDADGVHVEVVLAAPSCKKVAYILEVADGSDVLGGTDGRRTAGASTVTFDFDVTDPTPADGLCVAVSTLQKRKLFDQAPDGGCVTVTLGGGPVHGFS